ncbi:MAG: ABC-2 transporter permease [Oscillospiraceae bacterium]|nr:ABC-2 transporter permease [Oscillospiraceae bacterium]
MHAMLTKEWYTQGKRLCLLLLAFALIGAYNIVLYFLLVLFLAPLIIALLPLFSLSRDAVSHFDRWYPVLPMKRSTYADFYYIMTAVLTGLFLLVNALLYLHTDSTVDCRQLAGLLAGLGTLCLLMPAVYLPVTFRFGITAGRIAALLMLPVYVLFPFFGFGVIDWFNWFSPENRSVGTMVLGLCMLLIFLLSRMLSVRALRRAES